MNPLKSIFRVVADHIKNYGILSLLPAVGINAVAAVRCHYWKKYHEAVDALNPQEELSINDLIFAVYSGFHARAAYGVSAREGYCDNVTTYLVGSARPLQSDSQQNIDVRYI